MEAFQQWLRDEISKTSDYARVDTICERGRAGTELRHCAYLRQREIGGHYLVSWKWSNGRDIPSYLYGSLDLFALETIPTEHVHLLKDRVRHSRFVCGEYSIPASETIAGHRILTHNAVL